MRPKLSIITVCYNSADTIRSTIESVLSQECDEFEYVIVDGASSDDTIKIVDEFNDSRIKLVSESDSGIWDAMNKGVGLAKGEYVTFLNSDDVYENKMIVKESLQKVDEDSLDLMFGFVDIYDIEMVNILRRYRVQELSLEMLKIGVMPAHPGSLIRRSIFLSLGGFSWERDVPPDYFLFLEVFVAQRYKVGCLQSVMVNMRSGGLGNSSVSFKIKRQYRMKNALNMKNIQVSLIGLFLKKLAYRRKEFSNFRG